MADQLFRLNSIYDPDATNAGHQPIGHDEWALIYAYYRVMRTKVEVEMAVNVATSAAVIGVVCPNRSVAIDTTPYGIAEGARGQMKIVIAEGVTKFKASYSIAELFGVTKEQYGSDNYAATFGADPADVFYVHVSIYDASGSMFTIPTIVATKLSYICEFYQRVELEPSLMKVAKQIQKEMKEKKNFLFKASDYPALTEK